MNTTLDLITPVSTSLAQVIEVFDAELRSDLPFVNHLTEQVRRYRGKLLRPNLLLLAGEATGESNRDHVVLAAGVEMVHMATLVHDDVLDEADVRRRNVTINRMIGNEGAVLLGDFLISHAYHLCSSFGATWASRRVAAVTNVVCEGELMQIENRGNFELTEADYLEIIRRKTAALTGLCCELGATVSDAPADWIEHLAAYGAELGMAFQIVDDLLDLNGTEKETGKSVGRDAEMGKLTLPLIRFLEQATPRERAALIEALGASGAQKTAGIREVISNSNCVEQALDAARGYVTSALAHLQVLPDSPARSKLIAAAEFVIRRRT
ncbi:MAG: polyprenyl synthetase family protein [Planctomycetes bacterium]|nr:polyprenyl synthetase family protein [Planctomycetota bacterium]